MARTKAQLIEDAKGRGHVLTGDETTGDLKALLEGDGEAVAKDDGEEVAAVAEPTAEEQAVIDAKAKVDEAKAVLAEATATHAAAVEAHTALTKGPDPVPGEHIVVDRAVMPQPEGYAKEYRLNIGGRNVEHTHDTDSGVWCYTSKP